MLLSIAVVFIVGYMLIAFEHQVGLNKAASALLTGVLCWTIYILSAESSGEREHISEVLSHHLGEISGILFFLLGAMTIVELIDAHDGFNIISGWISTERKTVLLWVICMLAFVLSAIIDNLTTTIVMVSITRKILADPKERLLLVGMIVVSANAGGAWSPIGDVTTTMLWIGGQVTPGPIILNLILPSLVCMIVPLVVVSFFFRGKVARPTTSEDKYLSSDFHQKFILISGIAIFLLVPVFKTVTHLPPFMGMLMGLGLLWVISEFLHWKKDEEDKNNLSVVYALRKIDTPSILFFLGILISISALQATGQLSGLAATLDENLSDKNILVVIIGLVSSVVDNVPLVAGVMGMYDLNTFPADHNFWHFIAYCAGTGGSALIIGSAAGVAAMGMEKINFFWYVRNISLLALLGYFAGAMVFILSH